MHTTHHQRVFAQCVFVFICGILILLVLCRVAAAALACRIRIASGTQFTCFAST
jgi:hypothetical protein